MAPRSTVAYQRTLAAMTFTAASLLLGYANGHDRPGGHSDITFSVSPGGDEFIFDAAGEGGRDLDRLDLNGFRGTRIVATPDYEVDPEFSPDRKSVAYAAGKPDDRADRILLRSLVGKSLEQLTDMDENEVSVGHPTGVVPCRLKP